MNFILFGSTAIVCDNLIGSVHADGGKILVRDRNGQELVTYDAGTDAVELEMSEIHSQLLGYPPG